jgi:hypothetical protein
MKLPDYNPNVKPASLLSANLTLDKNLYSVKSPGLNWPNISKNSYSASFPVSYFLPLAYPGKLAIWRFTLALLPVTNPCSINFLQIPS